MSQKTELPQVKMPLSEARYLAEALKDQLAPFCDRIEIAGSIRREKPFVHDIELVAIPKVELVESDLFGGEVPKRMKAFCETLLGFGWHKLGDPTNGKYVKIELHEGICLDLFMCVPQNWGYIFMLRTGSSWFNEHIMIKRLKDRYYEPKDGWVNLKGNSLHTPEELDVFDLMKLEPVEPQFRNEQYISLYKEKYK